MPLSTKQKWFVGCGGCLGVMVLLFVLFMSGLLWFHNASAAVANELLGKEPTGYFTFVGIKSEENTVAMLANQKFDLLFAEEVPGNAEAEALAKMPDTKEKSKLQAFETDLRAALAKTGNGAIFSAIDGFMLEGVSSFQAHGKTFKVLQLRGHSNNVTFPLVITFVPKPEGQMLRLSLLDTSHKSVDSQQNLDSSYQEATQFMRTLVETAEAKHGSGLVEKRS